VLAKNYRVKGISMHKLQHFTFNGVKFQFRLFDRADEITPIKDDDWSFCIGQTLQLFEKSQDEGYNDHKANLMRMIGLDGICQVIETGTFYIDDGGVVWPEDTIAVIQRATATDQLENPFLESLCVLVSPVPRRG
jgi:hypothetical protein